LERKVVIVFGFDDSYFDYIKKHADRYVCPNELYVACTRASERLTLIHGNKHDFLPFLRREKLGTCAIMIGETGEIEEVEEEEVNVTKSKDNQRVQVTDILRHLPTEIIDECIKYLDITNTTQVQKKIDIKQKITGTGTTEEVSEINGTSIPAYYEYIRTGKMTILDWCIEFGTCDNDFSNKQLNKFWKKYSEEMNNIRDNDNIRENLLKISTLYCSLRSGYIFKMEQITKYDWIDDKTLQECQNRFKSLDISEHAEYEVPKTLSNEKMGDVPELLNITICGSIDCIDNRNIYEFKCVDKLEKTHYIQLAIYMYIHMIQTKRNRQYGASDGYRYILYNVLTGEMIEIKCEMGKLKRMMKYLMHSKYANIKPITDAKFIHNTKAIYSKYFS
jgi:hypothetical protein